MNKYLNMYVYRKTKDSLAAGIRGRGQVFGCSDGQFAHLLRYNGGSPAQYKGFKPLSEGLTNRGLTNCDLFETNRTVPTVVAKQV